MTLPPDPWQAVTTYHGLAADQVISALQKQIRRGEAEQAALLAYELLMTSAEAEDYLWMRLQVISVEDIGMAQPEAPVLIQTLYTMHQRVPRGHGDRPLFAVHAARYLAGCRKDRSSDECLNWIRHATSAEGLRPDIPDYALDMHTAEGQRRGRDLRHFLTEGARIAPEWDDRDRTYRERLLRIAGVEG